MVAICTAIAAICAVITGIWQLFGRKNRLKRESAEVAQKEFTEGLENEDPSKITAAFDRIKRTDD